MYLILTLLTFVIGVFVVKIFFRDDVVDEEDKYGAFMCICLASIAWPIAWLCAIVLAIGLIFYKIYEYVLEKV